MIVAGEASGDVHGHHLARELLFRDTKLRLFGMGSSMMAKAGVRLLYDPTEKSSLGFGEALRSVFVLRRLLDRLTQVIERHRPDALVLIDFPGFNMRLAERAKQYGVPIVYYFSPSAWAWGKGRAKKVASHAEAVLAVFPFEADVYREAGANVEFVGHPLVDTAKAATPANEFLDEINFTRYSPVLGLLPGSRRQEIDNHLSLLIEAAQKIREQLPNAGFLLPLAHTVNVQRIKERIPRNLPFRMVTGRNYDVIQAVDAAAVCMGTATLESALIGTPIVSFYRTSKSTYFIGKLLYRGNFVSLPNIIAQRKIIEELLQGQVTAQAVADELLALLRPTKASLVLKGFSEVRQRLGGPGAVGRAADAVLKVALRSREGRQP